MDWRTKLSWALPPGKIVPTPRSGPYHRYEKDRLPAEMKARGTWFWLLTQLAHDGPLSQLELWKRYVVERKGENLESLKKRKREWTGRRYRAVGPLTWWYSSYGPKYYQGVSARIADLSINGYVLNTAGGWAITERGYKLYQEILSANTPETNDEELNSNLQSE